MVLELNHWTQVGNGGLGVSYRKLSVVWFDGKGKAR